MRTPQAKFFFLLFSSLFPFSFLLLQLPIPFLGQILITRDIQGAAFPVNKYVPWFLRTRRNVDIYTAVYTSTRYLQEFSSTRSGTSFFVFFPSLTLNNCTTITPMLNPSFTIRRGVQCEVAELSDACDAGCSGGAARRATVFAEARAAADLVRV